MIFFDKLEKSIKKNNSLLCIGLDGDLARIPKHLLSAPYPLFEFNRAIIDDTSDLVCCYKPQIAYYSAAGAKGLQALKQTIEYIHDRYTSIPVLLDAKRGDIGSTAEKYTEEVFDQLHADAVTVNPYLGFDSVEPFLKRADKGIVILCRTSNPGASDFQDLIVEGKPLYQHVAKRIVDWHQKYQNCLMVVGATWPEQLKDIREIAKDMFFLVPGVGAQGGDLKVTLTNGLRDDKSGLIISSSRGIIYAGNGKDFAKKARDETQRLKNQINTFRK